MIHITHIPAGINHFVVNNYLLEKWGCTGYNILDEKERNHRFKTPSGTNWCDKTGVSYKRSPKWQGEGWYRIMAPAGTQLVEQYAGTWHCGTGVTGWLEGSHSGIGVGQTVDRKVCFDVYRGSCASYPEWSLDIKIRNCGNFFIYYLKDVNWCNSGYCAQ